jgi:hypothetical protein
MPAMLLKVTVEWHNRIEADFGEITDRMELVARRQNWLFCVVALRSARLSSARATAGKWHRNRRHSCASPFDMALRVKDGNAVQPAPPCAHPRR